MAELPDEVRALFEGPNLAHVATILPSGGPHFVPVWVQLEGERLAFFTQPGTRKARNLERDDRWPCRSSTTRTPTPWRRSAAASSGTLEGEAALR